MDGNILASAWTEQHVPNAIQELIPDQLLTSTAFFEKLERLRDFQQQQKAVMDDLKFDLQVPHGGFRRISHAEPPSITLSFPFYFSVDEAKIKAMKMKQNDDLTRLTDEAAVIGSNTLEIMNTNSRYFKFLLENPLRKFIPKSKLFNGLTYPDFEREFMLYYNMIAAKGSQ